MNPTVPYPHVPVEEQLQRIKAADTGPRLQIYILGAGIAGLAAAWVLRGLGHTVTIFEASERIGGRIYTYRFGAESDGLYGELGAMRIPGSHDYTRYFITQMQLTLRNFITALANQNAFLDLRGRVSRIADGQKQIYPLYQLSDWERTQYPGAAIFGQHLESLIGLMTPAEQIALFAGDTSTPLLRYLDSLTLGDFLLQRGQAADSAELMGSFTSLDGWLDKAVTMFLRDTMVDTSTGLQEIVGGMDLLPRRLADTMTDCITTNAVVEGVDATPGGGVTVTVRSGTEVDQIVSNHVLTTIPFTVMRRMALTGFSDDKMTSIRNLNYASATKVLLNVSDRFWETEYGIFGGASISDRMTRQTYYPSDHADQNAESHRDNAPPGPAGIATRHYAIGKHPAAVAGGPGVLLASYTLGQDAVKFGALTPDQRAAQAIQDIGRYHPTILNRGVVIGNASMAWDQYPWAAGAFSFLWPNQLGRLYQAAIRSENGLYFAGEHCSTDQAWIQGSLISSLKAVEQMVSAPAE